MEKQRIFWVVLSVSVFVVIVLIVGVYLLRQKPLAASTPPPGAINPITGPGPQVFEYSQQKPQGQAAPGTEPKPGEQQTMHFYIGEGAERPQTNIPQAPGAQPQTPPLAQPQTPPQTPGTQGQPLGPTTQVQPQGPAAQAQPHAPAVHPSVTSPRPRMAAVPKRPSPVKVTARPREQSRRSVDFWIQTGSYKSQSKADELIATLADKGLSGKVFSYDVHGGTYYRVRIGPYTNQGEADKFLSIVKQIQGLETSYVSQVGGLRNLN
ncbi:MAG: SPOR domain-containing protein [Spirochaetia bacterium]